MLDMQKIKNGVTDDMTDAEIAARNAVVALSDTESAATRYIFQRQDAYPSIEDQLDKIYHEGLDAWKAEIKAIKDAHPKP